MLPVAGYAAGAGRMSVVAAWVGATVGSLVGAVALYWLGRRAGARPVAPVGTRLPLVDVTDLDRSEAWFTRHGGRAVLLGRCVPVVRSLVSVPAGVERMPLRTFVPFTLVGSGVWNAVFVGAG